MLTRRAEAGARAKGIFLATMSHEIRTPLNGIIGMADLMREAPMGADQLSKLSVISDCSDTLLALIDDILDFSKLESGAVEFERAPFELGSVCEAVANVMGQRALEKGIELKVTHPQMLVTTDATRLGHRRQPFPIRAAVCGLARPDTASELQRRQGTDGTDLAHGRSLSETADRRGHDLAGSSSSDPTKLGRPADRHHAGTQARPVRNRAAANRTARVAWSIMARGGVYRAPDQ